MTVRDWQDHYARMKRNWHHQHVCRIPHDDMELIRRIAKRNRESINETILKYITWGLETEGHTASD